MLSQQEALITLKKFWQVDEFQFLGVLDRPKNEDGSLKNFGFLKLKLNDKALKYPMIDGYRYNTLASIFIPNARTLVNGKTYFIKVDIAAEKDRVKQNNPLLLAFKEIFEIEQTTDVLSPKDFIANWFGKKGENPGDAASIAAQLRLNQLELYTQTKRFVFELIQNADDMPIGRREVEIDIRLLENYFLFQHTGQYFTRENVKAICDAAQSTKRNDETKTGYKGIGFKSVFSDSEKVFIYSQDYSFKFDKSADVYSDFRRLYKPYWNILKPEAQRNFFLDFKGQEDKYTNIDNIPWQIKPIWVDFTEYPDEISPFINKSKNVNISLAVGESKIREKNYDAMIASLVEDPRFLLFLRNTKCIRYTDPRKKEISIRVVKENNQTKVYTNDALQSVYASYQDDIEINNNAFANAGFDLEHVEVEVNKFVFRNKKGKILENIPEKLGKLNETVISFAVKIENNKIIPIRESESILYNYLPTSDDKYKFPFIVNADFVSKTDREGILAENIWNHYLFYHIGYSLIHWVTSLSESGLWSTYLKVLPKQYLDECNQERDVINSAFNRGLKKGIDEVEFIIDSGGKKRLASEVVYDKSGLANVLGSITYLHFVNSDKHLANNSIEENDLKIPYLEIEVIGNKNIKPFFANDDSIEILNGKIALFNNKKYNDFLKWLNSSELSYDELSKVKFIAFEDGFHSLEETYETKNKLFLFDQRLENIGNLIKHTGGKISSTDLSTFPELYDTITEHESSYFNQKNGLYHKVVSLFEPIISTMDAQGKYMILELLRSIDGIDIKTIAKLPWYKNALGNLKPLTKLYDSKDFIYSSKYNDFFLHHLEIQSLTKLYLEQANSLVELLADGSFSLAYSKGITYDAHHEDIRLLEVFISLAEKDANIYQALAKKITWNGHMIDGDLFLDEVSISFKNAKGKEIQKNFKLVNLISKLTTNNRFLDELLSSLVGLKSGSKEVLRTDVFKLREYKRADIITSIQSSKHIISYDMFFYLAIDAWFDRNTQLDLGHASFEFIDSFIITLLNYILDHEISNRSLNYKQNGVAHHFLPRNKFVVFDQDLLQEDEMVADIYQNWIANDALKRELLLEAGCYDERHLHYKFRKALSLNNTSECLELLTKLDQNEILLVNTAAFVQKVAAKIYDDSDQTVLVARFYSLLSKVKSALLAGLKYPFFSPKEKNLYFHPLNNIDACYRYDVDEWRGYEEEIANHIEDEEAHIIHKELSLPIQYQNKIMDVKISAKINHQMLHEHSELFSASYYESWSQKSQFPIYIYSGFYIPHILSFSDLTLEVNYDDGKLIHNEGNRFYISKQMETDLPFCIHDMDGQAWRSLTEAKFRHNPSNSGSSKPEKSELSEEEIESFKRLFGRTYSKSDKETAWLLVALKSLLYYESNGYDISGYNETLRKKFFEFTKDGKKLAVYPRSAKGDLLYITIQVWENLDNEDVELFVLMKKNHHRIIRSKEDLLIDGDKLLFSLNILETEKKITAVNNLFNNASINEFKYDINSETILFVRMNNAPEFKSLFEGIGNEDKDLYSYGKI